MRNFDYIKPYQKLLTPEIVALLGQIREYKGEQTLFIQVNEKNFAPQEERAQAESIKSSCALAGIFVSEEREKPISRDKTTVKTPEECEMAGYRDVLRCISRSYPNIPMYHNTILALHRDLFRYCKREKKKWSRDSKPLECMCTAYAEALKNPELDPLLLIPMFVLDFLCIHPFNDGNGRMSRLLALLLLYRSGYIVGKYISIERLIEQTKDNYYEALRASDRNWHEETNDYAPFVGYMLGVILAAYRDFSHRVQKLTTSGLSKPARVRAIVKDSLGKITKAEIMAKCPDISKITVDRALKDMLDKGEVFKISGGRYTTYIWNREVE